MKLSMDQTPVARAVSHATGVVRKRGNVPHYSNILLEAGDSRLVLTATDGDLTLISEIPAQIESEGTTTVSAEVFHAAVRGLESGAPVELSITENEKQLSLASGRAHFQLNALPSVQFPKDSQEEMPTRFRIPIKDLLYLFDKVSVAVWQDETRYFFNAIHLHVHKEDESEKLRAVASDGHRLALCEVSLPAGAEEMPEVLVSHKTIKRLLSLLQDQSADDAEVEICLSDRQIRFACGGMVLLSRLIDGSFPEYRKVLPSGCDSILEADTVAFRQMMQRAGSIVRDRERSIRLALEARTMRCFGSSSDGEKIEDAIEVTYQGKETTIRFNMDYLREFATKIDSEKLQMKIKDQNSAVLLREKSARNFFFVLMPMRLY